MTVMEVWCQGRHLLVPGNSFWSPIDLPLTPVLGGGSGEGLARFSPTNWRGLLPVTQLPSVQGRSVSVWICRTFSYSSKIVHMGCNGNRWIQQLISNCSWVLELWGYILCQITPSYVGIWYPEGTLNVCASCQATCWIILSDFFACLFIMCIALCAHCASMFVMQGNCSLGVNMCLGVCWR